MQKQRMDRCLMRVFCLQFRPCHSFLRSQRGYESKQLDSPLRMRKSTTHCRLQTFRIVFDYRRRKRLGEVSALARTYPSFSGYILSLSRRFS